VLRVTIHEFPVWHMYGSHLTALSIKPMTYWWLCHRIL